MKLFSALLFSLALALSPVGCGSTPERTAVNVATVEAKTANSALRAFVDYEKKFGASAALRKQVDDAFQKHRQAALTFANAMKAYVTLRDAPEPTTPENLAAAKAASDSANRAMADAEAGFIALVESILAKKGQP